MIPEDTRTHFGFDGSQKHYDLGKLTIIGINSLLYRGNHNLLVCTEGGFHLKILLKFLESDRKD